MTAVLQSHLPHAPWMDAPSWRLPGTRPLDPLEWLVLDDGFEQQMHLRERLIRERREEVHALLPEARPAANECLDEVLGFLPRLPRYEVGTSHVVRPDGVQVPIDRDEPLITLGRTIQDDVCLMLPGDSEHVLGGAILCFPASWTLAQKIGRPLARIHKYVHRYDDDIARRVQRLFDAIQPGRPMWRANAHLEDSPELFARRLEEDPHAPKSADPPYLRSERQTLTRLPKSGAVVFAIHTWMVRVADLSEAQRASLDLVRAQYRD